MQIVARSGGTSLPHLQEWKRLGNWMMAWLLIANAPFMLLWLIGCPPRPIDIMVIAIAGLSVRGASYPFRVATFLIVFGYTLIHFTCNIFDVTFGSFLGSLSMLGALRPAAAAEYVLAALVVAAVIGAGGWWLRKDADFRSPLLHLAAFACAGLLASVDTAATWRTRGSYKQVAPDFSPFGSGVHNSGLLGAVESRRHILIVMVEALGQPTSPAVANLLMKPWSDPRLLSRYSVTRGVSPYFGSTTTAEIRELCGRWGNYHEVLAQPDRTCLPHRLRGLGYRATGVHSFAGAMFQRSSWYPNVGFERMLFSEEMVGRGARRCAGVFPGACDRDLPRILAGELKGAREPQLLYWLTVNSHMPVAAHATIRTDRCEAYSAILAAKHPMACRLVSIYDDVAKALATEMIAEDFPPTDVLLVGDHMPPFFDSWNRSQFDHHHVPWVLLKHKHVDNHPGIEHIQL